MGAMGVKTKGLARMIAPLLLAVFAPAAANAAVEQGDAQADAAAWLAETRQAMTHLNYRGIVSYMKDHRLESMHVFHGVIGGIERERLLSVNTPMREVVRNADKVTCYYPENKSLSVDNKPSRHSFLLDLPNDLSALSAHYLLSLAGESHVAQRLARIVEISPRDELRYGRRLWIDRETKLPLKYQLLDETHQVLEEMAFNSLSVENALSEKELEPSTQVDASWKTKTHEMLPAESLQWSLNGVPSGFRLVSYTRLKRGVNGKSIDHILLSDGFSSVSIYIDEIMSDIFTAQPRKVGAINAYTRKLDDYLITVMGEVPASTVQSIGDGIRRQPPAPQ
jgi:sigma-E factor negative regulatory protein RseB